MPRRTPSSDYLAVTNKNNLSPRKVSWSPDIKAMSTVSPSRPPLSPSASKSPERDKDGTTSPSKHKRNSLYGAKTNRRKVSSKSDGHLSASPLWKGGPNEDTLKTPSARREKHSSLSNSLNEFPAMISPLSESISSISSSGNPPTKTSSKSRRKRRSKKFEESGRALKNESAAPTAEESNES